MKHLPEILMAIATILAILGCALPSWEIIGSGRFVDAGANRGLWEKCGNAGNMSACTTFPTDNKPASLVVTEISSILTVLALASSTGLLFTKHRYSRVVGVVGALLGVITLVVYLAAVRQDDEWQKGDVGPAFYLTLSSAGVAMIAVFVHVAEGGKKRRRR